MNHNQIVKMSLLFTLTILLLVACGNNASEQNTETITATEPIQVEITITPETPDPGDTVTIEATVTQNGEPVEDADEVEFELWKEGDADDAHELIEGEHTKNGIYAIEQTFTEEGLYYVIAHVTARGMHNMPQKDFHIGDAQDAQAPDEEHHEHDGHGHNGDGIMIHLMFDEPITANEETPIVAHVHQDGEPLTDARVQFEMWKEGSEQRQFFDTEERTEGEYVATITFVHAGDYHINTHIRKSTIHEHKQQTIHVKP